jgi:hypothetical protein
MSKVYAIPFRGVMVIRARSRRDAEQFVECSSGAPVDNDGTLEDLEVLPREKVNRRPIVSTTGQQS